MTSDRSARSRDTPRFLAIMLCGIVGSLMLSRFALAAGPQESSDLGGKCSRPPDISAFLSPLGYAQVTAASAHLYIHKDYPKECTSNDAFSCRSSVYLVPGDYVSIARTCGGWSYIQYVGERKDSSGWVANTGIKEIDLPIGEAPGSDCGEKPARFIRYARSHEAGNFNGQEPDSETDTLDVWAESPGGACFDLETLGPNGHECEAMGKLTRDQSGQLIFGSGQCRLRFKHRLKGFKLVVSPAWRRFGGGGICPKLYGCGEYGSIESGTFQ